MQAKKIGESFRVAGQKWASIVPEMGGTCHGASLRIGSLSSTRQARASRRGSILARLLVDVMEIARSYNEKVEEE